MDEIEQRLKEASETCINCYESWSKEQKDSEKREALMESIHELRKVAARLEIEMAISERDQMVNKPIPIPSHRSNNRRGKNNNDDNNGDSNGGAPDSNNNGGPKQPKVEKKPPSRRRKTGPSE